MSQVQKPRLHKLLLEALAEAAEWHLKTGGKHWKLFVNGQFAGVIPLGPKHTTDMRPVINTRSQIRRILSLTSVTH